jgi:AcrR family transcriptional regulator
MSEAAVSGHSPRRTARREREREHRRQDALAGATTVFAVKGFHDAQMTEIAAAAELSLASLYSMFEGKEAIYREVMRTAAEHLRDEVRSRVDAIAEPAECVRELVQAMFDYFERNRPLLRILLTGTRGLPWAVRERMGQTSKETLDDFYSWVIGLCRELVARRQLSGIDPEALSAAIVGTVTYFAAYALEERPEEPLSDLARQVQAIIAPAIEPEGPDR